MNKFFSVWVFSDIFFCLFELMSGVQVVGEKVNVFVLNEVDSVIVCYLGVDYVWLFSGKLEDCMIEDYVVVMVEIICQYSEGGVVLLLNMCWGKLLVVKLGYCLLVVVFNDVSEVVLQDGKVVVKYMVYGGLVIGVEIIVLLFVVIMFSSGMFDV